MTSPDGVTTSCGDAPPICTARRSAGPAQRGHTTAPLLARSPVGSIEKFIEHALHVYPASTEVAPPIESRKKNGRH